MISISRGILVLSTLIFLSACSLLPGSNDTSPMTPTPNTTPSHIQTNSGENNTASGMLYDPMMMLDDSHAPSVADSFKSINVKLAEEPVYRACISRATESCGSEAAFRIAQTRDNVTACDIFDDVNLKKTCVTAITIELAKKKMDPTLCSTLTSFDKSNCESQTIIAKAIQNKDPSMCASLKTSEPTPMTNSSATGTMPVPAISSTIFGQDSQCIMQVLSMMPADKDNLKFCKMITDDSIEKNCTQMIQSRIDMEKNMPIIPVQPIPPAPTTKSNSSAINPMPMSGVVAPSNN